MKLGIGIGLTAVRRRGGAQIIFDPATLFASGEQGAWYDPSDLSTMFTNTAGTTLAAVDDPVARINDKSGRGNHATQGTVAKRPILRQTAGGLYYLEFDGVDDEIQPPLDVQGAVDSDNTVCAAIRPISGSNFPAFMSSTTGTTRFGIQITFAGTSETPIFNVRAIEGNVPVQAASSFTDSDLILSGNWVRSTGTTTAWFNRTDTGTDTATEPSDKNYGSLYRIGSSGSNFYAGRMYGLLMVDRVLSQSDREGLEDYFAAKSGVTL